MKSSGEAKELRPYPSLNAAVGTIGSGWEAFAKEGKEAREGETEGREEGAEAEEGAEGEAEGEGEDEEEERAGGLCLTNSTVWLRSQLLSQKVCPSHS